MKFSSSSQWGKYSLSLLNGVFGGNMGICIFVDLVDRVLEEGRADWKVGGGWFSSLAKSSMIVVC